MRSRGAVRLIGAAALLTLALALGFVAGIPVLVICLAATQNRTVAIAMALIVLAGIAGFVALRAAPMLLTRRESHRFAAAGVAGAAILLAGLGLWWLVFRPAPMATPPTMVSPMFWDLPTGSRIAYEVTRPIGASNSTSVILVHGGPGSPSRDTASIGTLLADEGFDVYNYHQVGAGLSSRLDASEYTVDRHVADLDAIRGILGAEKVILIGASWGGQLIAEYMAAHPARVERAVVVSPNSIWTPAFSDDERLTEGGRRDQEAAVSNLPRFQFAHIVMNIIGPNPVQSLLPDGKVDGVFEAMVQDLNMWAGCADGPVTTNETSAGGYEFWVNAATTKDAQDVDDPRPALRHVGARVLILRGECDYIAWEVTREYRDVLPASILVPIGAAGHVIQQDQPQIYRELVRSFLFDEPLLLEPYTGAASPW